MAIDRESILDEIEDAYNIHGMSLANLLVASKAAQETISNIFREMSGFEYAVVSMRPPIDRLGMYYTISAIVGGPAWTAEDYSRANVFQEDIDIYSADPEQMPNKIFEALVTIGKRMADAAQVA